MMRGSKAGGGEKAKRALTLEQRLAKALAHPLRVELLRMLNEKPGAAVDLVKRLYDELGQEWSRNLVDYHMKQLERYDCIELVKSEQKRGARKLIFRGTTKMLIDKDLWAQMSLPNRIAISAGALGETIDQILKALDAGAFEQHKETAIINLNLSVDDQAWKEIIECLTRAYERSEAHEAVALNRTKDPKKRFPVTVSLLAYESAR